MARAPRSKVAKTQTAAAAAAAAATASPKAKAKATTAPAAAPAPTAASPTTKAAKTAKATKTKKSTGDESTASIKLAPEPSKGKAKQQPVQQQPQQEPTPTDRRVSQAQALKAINALIAHRQKRTAAAGATTADILPNTPTARDDNLFLQFALKRLAPPSSSSPFPKPAQVALPHPLLSSESASVCLIVKDPQREYKDLLASLNIRSIARVVGVTKLKGKFAPFEARRQLMSDHDLFLVDDRVVGMMPRLLGKKWMDSKKPPIPVKLTHTRHLAQELDRAIGSTYYNPTRGSCLTIRIGSLVAHTPQQLVDNLEAAIPAVIQRLKPIDSDDPASATAETPATRSRWNNVQAIELKTGSSMALPVWTSSLAERWVGMEQESAKAKEVRELKAAKRAAKEAKDVERKKRKLLKGAKAVEQAMEESDDDEEDDDDDEEEDGDEVAEEASDDDEE
ncbi:unnamed protein product [Tilletia laevis]|uniref:Ribosomal protein L1 n=2 Tax=Tilletia TaxID=13289 RepID=A0A177VFS6_9BASI|nr:hypothetical protein CF336_g4551 [Tilletia laevis]KAE8264527.1 hypothetical protein A4X03_0g886 [Tilletia caries]KAE8206121.1 hypothetical protein CF335_g2068 [Tilletia laevis]CAD6890366.1 unnamed protein product [Tilletia caries]CAD6911578.1 unnamed protein product [Tilletia caries]